MSIKISYQTLHLPPPFAYAYTLDINLHKDEAEVKLDLEYLNRDHISIDEILSEGFTENDDYNWHGKLGKNWANHLASILKDPKLRTENDTDQIWIHVSLDNKEGLVKDTEFWDYELQELIQAIYEKSKKEEKLKVKLLSNDDNKKRSYEIIGSFGDRKATINNNEISWKIFREILTLSFSGSHSESGTEGPKAKGLWLNTEPDPFYYEILSQSTKDSLITLLSRY